ncbi:MAG: FecR family protein [Sulfuricurvum sp.]
MKTLTLLLLVVSMLFASVGEITMIDGKATITRGSATLDASLGGAIEQNDLIKTADLSKLRVRFSDDTIITIGKNSSLDVATFVFDQKSAKAELKVTSGTFHAITGGIGKINPDKFKLKTKTASIGIRGTQIVGDQSRIFCTEGAITVESNGVSVDVDAGSFVQVFEAEPPSEAMSSDAGVLEELSGEVGASSDGTQGSTTSGATGSATGSATGGTAVAVQGTATQNDGADIGFDDEAPSADVGALALLGGDVQDTSMGDIGELADDVQEQNKKVTQNDESVEVVEEIVAEENKPDSGVVGGGTQDGSNTVPEADEPSSPDDGGVRPPSQPTVPVEVDDPTGSSQNPDLDPLDFLGYLQSLTQGRFHELTFSGELLDPFLLTQEETVTNRVDAVLWIGGYEPAMLELDIEFKTDQRWFSSYYMGEDLDGDTYDFGGQGSATLSGSSSIDRVAGSVTLEGYFLDGSGVPDDSNPTTMTADFYADFSDSSYYGEGSWEDISGETSAIDMAFVQDLIDASLLKTYSFSGSIDPIDTSLNVTSSTIGFDVQFGMFEASVKNGSYTVGIDSNTYSDTFSGVATALGFEVESDTVTSEIRGRFYGDSDIDFAAGNIKLKHETLDAIEGSFKAIKTQMLGG